MDLDALYKTWGEGEVAIADLIRISHQAVGVAETMQSWAFRGGAEAGAAAERARIRRELLGEIESGNLGEAYAYLPDLRAVVDRICPGGDAAAIEARKEGE